MLIKTTLQDVRYLATVLIVRFKYFFNALASEIEAIDHLYYVPMIFYRLGVKTVELTSDALIVPPKE